MQLYKCMYEVETDLNKRKNKRPAARTSRRRRAVWFALACSWCGVRRVSLVSLSKGGAVCEGLGYLAGALQLVDIINKGAAGVYWENQLGGFVGPAPAVAVAAAR